LFKYQCDNQRHPIQLGLSRDSQLDNEHIQRVDISLALPSDVVIN